MLSWRIMSVDLPNKFYTLAWIGWVMYFLVIEGLAILDKDPGETFSAHVVWVKNAVGSFAWFMIGATCLWLFYHFLFERGRFT